MLPTTCPCSSRYTTALAEGSGFKVPSTAATESAAAQTPLEALGFEVLRYPLLPVFVLLVPDIIRRCDVDVLQVQIGHISYHLFDSRRSLPHFSCHLLLLPHRSVAFSQSIGLHLWRKVFFSPLQYLENVPSAIEREIWCRHPADRSPFGGMYQRNLNFRNLLDGVPSRRSHYIPTIPV